MRRKKSRGQKKPSAAETSPEALAEIWKVVEEELKATGFQVSVRLHLRGAAESPLEGGRGVPVA